MAKRALDLTFAERYIRQAQEAYTQFSLEQSSDYDKAKELILKAYELIPEAYRQKFSDCKKRT